MNGIDKATLKKVRRIQIKATRMVEDILAGQYHSVFKGRGMEFDEVREYVPGDDIRTIDWNVTARANKPYIKKFVEERELTVMFVVDISSSHVFGGLDKSKNELTAELCSVLAFSAIENNDKVGVIMFSGDIEKYIPPKKGKKHVLRVTKELLDAGRIEHREKKQTNITGALDYLARVVKKRAVVFFVSDFQADGFQNKMSVMSRKHDLIAVHISDPLEDRIPDIGIVQMQDPETGEVILVNTGARKFRDDYLNARMDHQGRLMKFFHASKIDYLDITTEDDYLTKIIRFFRMREKRIRHG